MSVQHSYRSLFRESGFRLLWTGESCGRVGFQLTNFLLPLLAVTALGASGTEVGSIATVQFLPVVLFSLVAGAMLGRMPLRLLLVACNCARAGALAFLGAMEASGGLRIGHLLVAAAVVGTATVCYDVAYQASLPLVLSVEKVPPANGLLQATYSVTQLGGPAAAGFLLQKFGAPTALGASLVLFAAATLSFVFIPRIHDVSKRPQSVVQSVAEGLRYVWRCRPIRDLCLQAGAFNLYEQAFLTAFMVVAVRELGVPGGMVGVIVGVGSIGALVGALLAPKVRFVRVGVLVCAALPCAGIGFLLVPISVWLFGSAVAPLAVAFLINGFALSFFNVFAVSLRQCIPPERLLGAATASYRLVSFGTIPVGAFLGGVAIDLLGGSSALWLIGGMLVVTCLLFAGSPLRQLADLASAAEFAGRWAAADGEPVRSSR